MAITMMGGLLVATILTLSFLPALYAFLFRVQRPDSAAGRSSKSPETAVASLELDVRLPDH
jgi:hypothetical protein